MVTINISELEYDEYSFHLFNDKVLVFNSYTKYKKESRRHKFKVVKTWNRVGYTRDNCEQPILTDGIKNMALLDFVSQLEVKTWEEFKR